MERDEAVTEVETKTTRCSGRPDTPHAAVELHLVTRWPVTCPRCGRRFRRVSPSDRVDPAAWPKES